MAQTDFAKDLNIGIIMDGNGRWAKKRGLPRTAGHKKGAEVFQDITRYCNEIGVKTVTYYAFSTENWARPENEVASIMKLFKDYLIKAFDYKKENNKVVFLGDRSVLKPDFQEMMAEIEDGTKNKTGMILNIAINYGGRNEITEAVRQIAVEVEENKLSSREITQQTIAEHLYTKGQTDPDFILRPSGEKRLSNFLIWQSSYSEFVFMDVLWPDFKRSDLDAAIAEYNTRTRRFGGI
ncbi:MAG: isoprenyl transferase [Oscillospiraceae bacterium]